MHALAPADYLAPDVPAELPWHDVPLVRATDDALRGYGRLVDDHRGYPIEIVTWPKPGWRDVDPGTGNEGGTTSASSISGGKGRRSSDGTTRSRATSTSSDGRAIRP